MTQNYHTPHTAGDALTASELNTVYSDLDSAITGLDTDITAAEGDISTLQSDVTTAEGNITALETTGYRYVQTVYFTSSGTFAKADYAWLRAVRVRCVGGGGGSGGCIATSASEGAASGGGGGGGFALKFLLATALGASETVTVGAGGTAGPAGNNAGGNGGASSFGTHCVASGGTGSVGSGVATAAVIAPATGTGGTGTTGDLLLDGGTGPGSLFLGTATSQAKAGDGGASAMGPGPLGVRNSVATVGTTGDNPGTGASGSVSPQNTAAQAGAVGAAGIVIVDLYA